MGNVQSDEKAPSIVVDITRVGRDLAGRGYPEVCMTVDGESTKQVLSLEEINRDEKWIAGICNSAGIGGGRTRTTAIWAATVKALDAVAEKKTRADFDVASKTGWCKSGFVTPMQTYCPPGHELMPVLGRLRHPDRWTRAGSLEGWQRHVYDVGKGNPLVIFLIGVPFVGPLLGLFGSEGFGFQLNGETGTGKTSVCWTAASVWGGHPVLDHGYLDTWNTTKDGVERLVAPARDGFIVLDDTSLIKGSAAQKAELVDQTVFGLASGTEKTRLTDTADGPGWRVVFLSSSNRTLAEIFAAGGRDYDGSHAARLIQIPANRAFGVFDEIPAGLDAAMFADSLRAAARQNYGYPIDGYLKYLVKSLARDKAGLITWLTDRRDYALRKLGFDMNAGRQSRIASALALVYTASSLAAEAGVLPWPKERLGSAIENVAAAIVAFQENLGVKRDELAEIREYIRTQRHLFVDVRAQPCRLSDDEFNKAAGFITCTRSGPAEFSFMPDMFRQKFGQNGSMDSRITALKSAKLLINDGGKSSGSRKNQTKRQIRQGEDRPRVYCISAKILGWGSA